MEGTAWMQASAFVLAAELADSDADRSLFRTRADALVGERGAARPGGAAASPWFQIYLDRAASDR